jgi:hypothetical protein
MVEKMMVVRGEERTVGRAVGAVNLVLFCVNLTAESGRKPANHH